jgi:hypothetical protein
MNDFFNKLKDNLSKKVEDSKDLVSYSTTVIASKVQNAYSGLKNDINRFVNTNSEKESSEDKNNDLIVVDVNKSNDTKNANSILDISNGIKNKVSDLKNTLVGFANINPDGIPDNLKEKFIVLRDNISNIKGLTNPAEMKEQIVKLRDNIQELRGMSLIIEPENPTEEKIAEFAEYLNKTFSGFGNSYNDDDLVNDMFNEFVNIAETMNQMQKRSKNPQTRSNYKSIENNSRNLVKY